MSCIHLIRDTEIDTELLFRVYLTLFVNILFGHITLCSFWSSVAACLMTLTLNSLDLMVYFMGLYNNTPCPIKSEYVWMDTSRALTVIAQVGLICNSEKRMISRSVVGWNTWLLKVRSLGTDFGGVFTALLRFGAQIWILIALTLY